MAQPLRAGGVLDDVLRRLGLGTRVRETRAVLAWPEVVGTAAAARSRAVACRGGRLVVEVDSSPWMQELACLSGEIREKLNRRLEEDLVAEIVLRAAGGGPRSSGERESPRSPREEKQGG